VEIVDGPPSVDGAFAKVRAIATLLHEDPAPLVSKMERELAEARALVARSNGKPRVLALYARGAGTAQAFGVKTAADTMIALAGGENVLSFEGAKALTAESVVEAKPDVVLIPARGLESLGGRDALFSLPGLAGTPAAKSKRVVALDDVLLLGFGPRLGEGVAALAKALHPELGAAP
jgi:iron complex transport system substrate-binding protein